MTFNKLLTIVALVVLAFSCTKETKPEEEYFYIKASSVDTDATKTEMDGLDVVWLENEKISLSNGTSRRNATNTNGKGKNGAFKVSSKADGTWYAFHPQDGDKKSGSDTPLGIISPEQYPTLSSFDGNSDVMLSEAIDISTTDKREIHTVFHRLCGVVKIVFTDNTKAKTYSQDGDYVTSVSFRNAKYPLCGESELDLEGQCYKEGGHQTTKTCVTAVYDADDNFVINGTNAAYLIVVPWEITNGYTFFNLTMHDGATYEKRITTYTQFEDNHILLEANKVTTFNISIKD